MSNPTWCTVYNVQKGCTCTKLCTHTLILWHNMWPCDNPAFAQNGPILSNMWPTFIIDLSLDIIAKFFSQFRPNCFSAISPKHLIPKESLLNNDGCFRNSSMNKVWPTILGVHYWRAPQLNRISSQQKRKSIAAHLWYIVYSFELFTSSRHIRF